MEKRALGLEIGGTTENGQLCEALVGRRCTPARCGGRQGTSLTGMGLADWLKLSPKDKENVRSLVFLPFLSGRLSDYLGGQQIGKYLGTFPWTCTGTTECTCTA